MPADRTIARALEHLRGIREQAADLEALLIVLDFLPEGVTVDALADLDDALSDMVQTVAETGPEGAA